MAMTKAERAEMERYQLDAALARALRFPTDSLPTPMTKAEIEASRFHMTPARNGEYARKVAIGWFYNSHSVRVTKGASDGNNHCVDGISSWSQNIGRMFRTEAEAWRALRHEKARMLASILASIDAQVERAEQSADQELVNGSTPSGT